MQRVVGGVQVQHDAVGRLLVCLQEQIDQQSIHRLTLHHDLLVALGLPGLSPGQLQSVQCALARQRLARVALPHTMLARDIGLAHQRRQQRVATQVVVIVEILIPQRQPVEPLSDQLLHRVLDQPRVAMIREAIRELLDDPNPLLHLAQQQAATVRGDRSTVEPPHNLTLKMMVKREGLLVTLCRHRAVSWVAHKVLFAKSLCTKRQPVSTPMVRNPG